MPFEASAWRFSRDNTTSAEHSSTPVGEEARGSFHFLRLLEHQPLALVSERHGLRLAQKQDPARGLVQLRSATKVVQTRLTARTLRLAFTARRIERSIRFFHRDTCVAAPALSSLTISLFICVLLIPSSHGMDEFGNNSTHKPIQKRQ